MNKLIKLLNEYKTLKDSYMEIEYNDNLSPDMYLEKITPIGSQLYVLKDKIANELLHVVGMGVIITDVF
jgi:hypothetical protein